MSIWRKLTHVVIYFTLFSKAAHTCLVIQNLCVVLCGILLFLLLGVFNREDNGSSFHELCTIVSVIALSSVAKVASAGTVIILQKDWIVVICKENTDQLAG